MSMLLLILRRINFLSNSQPYLLLQSYKEVVIDTAKNKLLIQICQRTNSVQRYKYFSKSHMYVCF